MSLYEDYPYVVGSVYSNGKSEYILALVDAQPGHTATIGLINMDDGNRWSDPIRINIAEGRSAIRINEAEFGEVIGSYHELSDWSCVRPTRADF